MVSTRRRFLRTTGAASLAALAGCSRSVFSGSDPETTEYVLSVDRIDAAPTAHARYSPSDDELFGVPARAALDDILLDGRHTTYGNRPLPGDAYVEHGGSYYQTTYVVTGRERLERTIDRGPVAETVPLSDPFAGLLDALDLGGVETGVNGRLLWYEGALYRYGLYVDDSA
jgi:hypothetical protein